MMRTLILLALFALASPSLASPPLEAYGELPEIRAFSLAPDGSRFALFKQEQDADLMIVYEMGVGEIAALNVSKVKPRSLHFFAKNYIIIGVSQSTQLYGGFERYKYYLYDIAENKLDRLSDTFNLGARPQPTDDPDEGVLAARSRSASAVLRWNFRTGRRKIIARGSAHTRNWLLSKNGDVVGREDYDDQYNLYEIYKNQDGKMKLIYQKKDVERAPMHLMGYTEDKELLVGLDEQNQDFQTIRRISDDGKLSAPLYNTDVNEPDIVYLDSWKKFLGVRYAGIKPRYYFDDPSLATSMNSLASLFPEDSVKLIELSEDLSKLVIYISGGKTAPGYYLYDKNNGQFGRLTPAYFRIDDRDIKPISVINYTARDGLNIPALVTHPENAKPGDKLPLIVYPHGGPESHDALEFDYRAQYFASQGYLVLQPNFRGSSGFGSAHRNAGYGEWGGKMQDDITDGVNFLVKIGWADPERICIIGASYGGYAALNGGATTPDLYQCVAAIAPVTDMQMMVRKDRWDYGRYSSTFAYMEELLGDMINNGEKLREISPANAAHAFQAPVLLIHGEDDTVVQYAHSEKMANALKAAGKDVTLIKLKGEDHWMSTSETRLEALQALDAFVKSTIGPAN